MPDCFVTNCKSRRTEKRKNKAQLQWEHFYGKKISFHRIPIEQQQRQKWLDAMKLHDDIPKNASICSLHFKEDDLDRTSLACTRIRSGAIPLKNLSMKNDKSLAKRQNILDKNLDSPLLLNTKTSKIYDAKNENSCDAQYTNISEAVGTKGTTISTSTQDTDIQQSSTVHCSKISHKEITISPKLSEDTPRERMLKIVLKNTRQEFMKKIKVLQQKQRRTMKCVARLNNILVSLKRNNLLHTEQLDILKDMDNFNQELLKHPVDKLNETSMPKKYKAELLTYSKNSSTQFHDIHKKFNSSL